MRRANLDTGWIEDEENGRVTGFNCGYDFCAEHEWGVKGIVEAFELNGLARGMEKGLITIIPDNFFFRVEEPSKRSVVETEPYAFLMFRNFYRDAEEMFETQCKNVRKEFKSQYTKKDFIVEWGERDFFVAVRGEENVKRLSQLHTSFNDKNIVIGMTPASFKGTGLTFLHFDRVRQEDLDACIERENSEDRLEARVTATGIREKLKAADCRYYALSPRFTDEEKDIEYWLNPMEQDIHNYGWMKLSDLEDWINGIGRVPMKEAKR